MLILFPNSTNKVLLVFFFLFVGLNSSVLSQEVQSKSNKINRGDLISYKWINELKANEINEHFPELEEREGDITHLPKYDIDLYKIVYNSTFKGKIIELSGLVIIPKLRGALRHLQFHHGTIFPYPKGKGGGSLDAPSLYDGKMVTEYKAQYGARLFGNYLGSYGYVVSMPDYIGYGVTSGYEHTYSVNNRLAEQSVDMILATRQLCLELNVELNDQLFLSGWSEGGAAAVATQKLIEKDYIDDIKVTANAPLAGFYNISYYSKKFIKLLPYVRKDWGGSLNVIIWTLYSMNQYADDSPIPNDKIFKYTVNDQYDVLNKRPSNRPSKNFRFVRGKNRKSLFKKFEENSLHDGWTPKAPIYFHHGTKDRIVYYPDNVEVAVNTLRENGGETYLKKYEGYDHYSLVFLYLLSMVEDFDKYVLADQKLN
ncbi:alpha/beta hydrolase family protein [Flammeovirga agarivorans]|uniref:Uncharacterized protein n=1 Tax=Flammeovirga agarivorans TaxID=2726742 RepID=A0A7X8SQN4_9BACT|nr:lipase family protein [Flammeovirga agarivorans]NLR94634.1 hypothetical protein [Flammeovirga agarivorans]